MGPDQFTVPLNVLGIPRALGYALEQCGRDSGCSNHFEAIGVPGGSAIQAVQMLQQLATEANSNGPAYAPCLSAVGLTFDSFKARIAGICADSVSFWPLVR